jgi:hypothetical protein
MTGHQGLRHVDIDQLATTGAVDMIVALAPAVISAGLIGEREFLDEAMLCQEMQRAIDGAIADMRIAAAHPLENLSGGEVAIGLLHGFEDHRALGGLAVFAFRRRSGVHH